MTTPTKLLFVNKSHDLNGDSIVVYIKRTQHKNSRYNMAWKVIKNCDFEMCHPFTFDSQYQISVLDGYGNSTSPIWVNSGYRYTIGRENGRIMINESEPVEILQGIQVCNVMDIGSIDVRLLNSGTPIDFRPSLAPGQLAEFDLTLTLYLGMYIREITAGSPIKPQFLHSTSDPLEMKGIDGADIVMFGAGRGANSQPITFSLGNIHPW